KRAAVLEVPACDCREEGTTLPATVEEWQQLVSDLTWEPTAVDGTDGAQSLAGVSLVVVPGAVCLGRPEAVALRSYVLNGGGLLSAGLLGVCGAPDRERAASRWLEELVGAEHVEPLRVAPGPASVAFRDGSPLAAGL